MFGPHCRMRCDLDRNQRQLVLIPKQRVGAIRDPQPAFHLGAAGQAKDGANTQPGYECQRVIRRNAMSIGEGRAMVFVQRPVSLILIVVVVAVLVLPRLTRRWPARRLPA